MPVFFVVGPIDVTVDVLSWPPTTTDANVSAETTELAMFPVVIAAAGPVAEELLEGQVDFGIDTGNHVLASRQVRPRPSGPLKTEDQV